MSYKKEELLTLSELIPFFDGVCVGHLFSFMCYPIICAYVLSSLLWCPLRFPHKTMFCSSLPVAVRSCHIYVTCFCLRLVVSTTYCVVLLLCFSSSCVPYVASFSGISIFGNVYSQEYLIEHEYIWLFLTCVNWTKTEK